MTTSVFDTQDKNNFETLSSNKIEFLKLLAFDDDLAKCILCVNKNFKDISVTDIQKTALLYTQIYPFPKTMKTITDTKSYITMRFKYKKSQTGNTYKTSYITFYLFCHEDIIQTSYMILRYDYMLQCVDRLLNDARSKGWLGKMQLDSMEDVIIDNDGKYIGVAVTYKNTEFQ